MSKGTVLTIVFLAFIAYLSFNLIWTGNKYECEICIVYKDREVCQKVKGMTKEETIMTGISTACGGAASGMTESIECQAQEPTRLQCREL
ncbi:MAG: hypothetical protein GWM98_10175 [Nitrospinaceae bacterium]|nr:hypothetical protein [Nitrospinaceae bacterium]NIR54787.1 hypothetical protein [Nitrospinaceae bacterium]NIS85213.1 hypothetical protein [Nitrospinaceae bacterium]NIT82023.1 hypothetical protein [Nitrospinaceae bacterium]NIU44287.1 hypothetical protein [Nitrospinaceae bacterium]